MTASEREDRKLTNEYRIATLTHELTRLEADPLLRYSAAAQTRRLELQRRLAARKTL